MYSQNDGRSLTARTSELLKTIVAHSRKEIATDQTVPIDLLLQKYPAQPRKEIARSYRRTDREDWQDACKAATSSSVRGGGRTGAAKSRDGYTLRPEAGSTS